MAAVKAGQHQAFDVLTGMRAADVAAKREEMAEVRSRAVKKRRVDEATQDYTGADRDVTRVAAGAAAASAAR